MNPSRYAQLNTWANQPRTTDPFVAISSDCRIGAKAAKEENKAKIEKLLAHFDRVFGGPVRGDQQ